MPRPRGRRWTSCSAPAATATPGPRAVVTASSQASRRRTTGSRTPSTPVPATWPTRSPGSPGVPNGDVVVVEQPGSTVHWYGPMAAGARLDASAGPGSTLTTDLGTGHSVVDAEAGTLAKDGFVTLRWTGFTTSASTGSRPRARSASTAATATRRSTSPSPIRPAALLPRRWRRHPALPGRCRRVQELVRRWGRRRPRRPVGRTTARPRPGHREDAHAPGREDREGPVRGVRDLAPGREETGDARHQARRRDPLLRVHGDGPRPGRQRRHRHRPHRRRRLPARLRLPDVADQDLRRRRPRHHPGSRGKDPLVGGPGRDSINGNANRDRCSGEKLKSCEIKLR